MSKRVIVPDQPKKVIKQKQKNKTNYGKKSDNAEPDTVSRKSVKRSWTIVSDNCYGVAYMKALAQVEDKPYDSPFFSIVIYAPDYITLLENFKEYMKIKYNSNMMKTILNANKDMSEGKFKISNAGLMYLHFTDGVIESEYYMVPTEDGIIS